MSAVRRGGAFPRRLRDNHARTSATTSFMCGIIFRSPCRALQHWSPFRAVRHSPPSSLDITRQRRTIDLFNLRASAASSQFRNLPSRCHHRPDLSGFHLRRRLLRIPTGASPAGYPKLYRHNSCLQASADGYSVCGNYLPSAFVGQPVGIDQVNDVWIGDSGATTHKTRNADMTYDTRPPSPYRSRIILRDGSIRKA